MPGRLQLKMAAWHVGVVFIYTITAVYFILITISPAIADFLSFAYPSFEGGGLKLEGAIIVSASEIDLSAGVGDRNNSYNVGRVTSIQRMKLWDMTTGKLCDFRTKFSLLLIQQKDHSRDGFAFFLADPDLPFSKNIEEGGGLGLVDGDQILNSTQHHFVAVEFDTHQNPWDPNGRHVGVNLNSMNSSITKPLDEILMVVVFDCIIDYNSATHKLGISYTHSNIIGVPLAQNYFSYEVDLREYLPEWVIVGFSGATKDYSQSLTLHSWSFISHLDSQIPPTPTPAPIPNPNHARKGNIGLFMGIGVGIPVAMASSIGLVCFLWKRKKTEGKEEESVYDLNMDDEFQKGSGPKKFYHDELVTATNNFSEAQKLGHGGFGDVYKGFLKNLNFDVAIKRISRYSSQGIKEYATEVKIISQLRHRNLVQLIGWCHKKKDLLLIYEFMPNGSLDSHLYNRNSFLTWEVRYNIALDLASALLYLHEEWEQCVLHRDIKASNIMLDSSFNAKLGDFGLARLVDHKKGSQTTVIAGTRGYIAPEYFITSKASKESDIYSFGVVMLEIASGRKPIDLKAEDEKAITEWVWELYELGKLFEVADPKLCGAFNKQQMERLVVLGTWCAHPDYSSRPSIRQVIQVLNFEAPLPTLHRRCLCQPIIIQ